mgnify:FL=1
MLILKKQLTEIKYEVLDTDDDVVEIDTRDNLIRYVKDLGLKIQGVDVDAKGYVTFNPQYNYSIKETKFKILRGIDIHVENGELVNLTYNESLQDTTIKLSDYCNFIAPHCFKPSFGIKTNSHITLILDNSLEFKSFSFIDCFYCGVIKIDVTALSDKKAEYVYKEAMKADALGLFPYNNSCIIDNTERLNYYWADSIMTKGFLLFNGQVSRLEEVLPDVDKYTKLMRKKYLKLFEHVANAEIRFNKNVCRTKREVKCATLIRQSIVNIDRYRTERARTFKVAFREFLTIDKPLSVDKLYNFVMIFNADDYCWSLWDRFCNNILEFVNKY